MTPNIANLSLFFVRILLVIVFTLNIGVSSDPA